MKHTHVSYLSHKILPHHTASSNCRELLPQVTYPAWLQHQSVLIKTQAGHSCTSQRLQGDDASHSDCQCHIHKVSPAEISNKIVTCLRKKQCNDTSTELLSALDLFSSVYHLALCGVCYTLYMVYGMLHCFFCIYKTCYWKTMLRILLH